MTTKKSLFETLEKKFGYLSFGAAIKSWRLSEESSQKDFAKKLGISAQNLNDLEKERKIPSASRASEIAKKLKISEIPLIQLALRDQLRKEGFKYVVSLEVA